MNKRRASWIVGAVVLSLLVAGVVVLAGNGMGRGASTAPQTAATCQADRDADGDGIPNGQDTDWVAPCDGSGYGATLGSGTECPTSCPNAEAGTCNGQGYGAMQSGARTCGGRS